MLRLKIIYYKVTISNDKTEASFGKKSTSIWITMNHSMKLKLKTIGKNINPVDIARILIIVTDHHL